MARQAKTLERPIIVLGAARSGTTLLAKTILAAHPDIAFWPEPAQVWRHGHAYRGHDVLRPEDATPRVRRYITGRFSRFLAQQGRARFMEKTPGNCLRMPFVMEVFPRAQVIHVLRDGRDVAISAAKEWSGAGTPRVQGKRRDLGVGDRLSHILRAQDVLNNRFRNVVDILELPAYAGRLVGVFRRQVLHSSRPLWGPRFPGFRKVRATWPLLETCALQWDLSVRMARSACVRLPRSQYMELRYEDLVTEPRREVSAILEFLEIDKSAETLAKLTAGVDHQARPKWVTGLSREQVLAMEASIADTLRELGYDRLGSDLPAASPVTSVAHAGSDDGGARGGPA